MSYSNERESFEKRTGMQLGDLLYQGDGDVYELKKYPARLVKIKTCDDYNEVRRAIRVIKKIHNSKNTAVVKLHQFGTFKSLYSFESIESTCLKFNYYYVMEKLKPFKIKNIHSHVDSIRDALWDRKKLKHGTPVKIKAFIRRASKLHLLHQDLHDGNIMVNNRGTIKLIDLESFMHEYF